MSDSALEARQQEIIEEFSLLDRWDEKYEHLLDQARALPPLPAEQHIEQNLIRGCQSQVWVAADVADGRMQFAADSDALITKGIIALLLRVLNGCTPQEVAEADLFFIDKIGLAQHLSPMRANGLVSMLRQLRAYAKAACGGRGNCEG